MPGMLEIAPQSLSLEEYLVSAVFQPADIQRDYQWTELEVRALVADLLEHSQRWKPEARSPVFFLGSMVATRSEPMTYMYDGLQRTTTLSILIAVLRDRISHQELTKRLDQCLHQEDGQPRLALPEPDTTYRKDICPLGATRHGIVGGFYGRRIAIRRSRNAIAKIIDSLPVVARESFARSLLEDVRLVLLLVRDRHLAEQVFETVNMRGLPIRPHDLIKSRLAQFARSESEARTRVSRWDEVRQRVASGFEDFVTALVDRWLAYPDLSRQTHMQQLTAWMARSQGGEGDRLGEFVSTAMQLTFAWNRTESCRSGWTRTKVMRSLLPISALGWSEWMPIAMEFVRRELESKISEPMLRRNLDLLQRRCLAVELAQLDQKTRRDVFRTALHELLSEQDPFDGALSFRPIGHLRRVRITLLRPIADYKLRRCLMLWLEAQGEHQDLKFLTRGPERPGSEPDPAQVEHILPLNVPEHSGWRGAFPSDEDRAHYPNKLGNLILVPKSVNVALGTKVFAEKRKILQSSRSRLAEYSTPASVGRESAWTREVIDRRTRVLSQKIWRELRLPGEVTVTENDLEADLAPAGNTEDDEVDWT